MADQTADPTIRCCVIDEAECPQPAAFEVRWGTMPDDYTHACEKHLGASIGVHAGQTEPDHYRVYVL